MREDSACMFWACSYTPEYADQKKSSFRGHVAGVTVRIVLAVSEGEQAGVGSHCWGGEKPEEREARHPKSPGNEWGEDAIRDLTSSR